MKRLMIKSVLALAAVAAFGMASAQERTLKFGLNGPEGHPAVAGMKKFKEIVEAKSGGKIKVNLFLNGTLGSDQAVVSAIKGGTIEMSVMNSGILASEAKELAIFDFHPVCQRERVRRDCGRPGGQEAARQAGRKRHCGPVLLGTGLPPDDQQQAPAEQGGRH